MSFVLEGSNYIFLESRPGSKVDNTSFREPLLQVCERNVIWIRESFFGQTQYNNYVVNVPPLGPMVVSYVNNGSVYKILVCTVYGCERFSVGNSCVRISFWRRLLCFGPHIRQILDGISFDNMPDKHLKRCKNPGFAKALLEMEEKQIIRSYKFGILYAAPGQITEYEMLGNCNTSPGFSRFLEFLGQKIQLKNWKFYRGGLDVSNSIHPDETSIYTKWQDYEIMFHVSTMLPYSECDLQQIERKRHIGNDIVVIVYQEDKSEPIKLKSFASRQNHVIAIVHSVDPETYEVVFLYKKGIPISEGEPFSASFPEIIRRDSTSRDNFLAKLVFGERASYRSPEFSSKILRTRTVLLSDLISSFGR